MTLIELIQQLSATFLTVREQARTAENDPMLSYPTYFPAENVESVKLTSITPVENIYIGDRREWDADGRYIPARLPSAKELEMVPLEAWFAINEREIQFWGERFLGNADLVIQAAKADITSRVSSLTNANIWANEYESIQAWVNGQIPVQNPQTGASYIANLNYDPNRYVLDGTPWDNTNAFSRLLFWAREALNFMGGVSGVVVRDNLALMIAESAPTIGANSVRMTLRQVQEYITDSIGSRFRIVTDERVKPKFDGAGPASTPTKLFPADTVAFIPADTRVGSTYQAPIYRSEDISAATLPDSVDMNGQRIFYLPMNAGKSLKVQAQANWLAVPDEQKVYIVNVTTA